MPKKIRLDAKDCKILDSWSVLIEGANGKAEEIYKETSRLIKESQAPDVDFEPVKIELVRRVFSWQKSRKKLFNGYE